MALYNVDSEFITYVPKVKLWLTYNPTWNMHYDWKKTVPGRTGLRLQLGPVLSWLSVSRSSQLRREALTPAWLSCLCLEHSFPLWSMSSRSLTTGVHACSVKLCCHLLEGNLRLPRDAGFIPFPKMLFQQIICILPNQSSVKIQCKFYLFHEGLPDYCSSPHGSYL